MKILGIDPGYAIIGYGVIEFSGGRYKPLDFGAITTDADTPFGLRLQQIYNGIISVIIKNNPDDMAIEKLYFQNNQKTAIPTPLQVKSAVTGYGQAHKPQVMEMTRRLLKLDKVPKPDDTADALAIAICHAQSSATNLKNLLNQRAKLSK